MQFSYTDEILGDGPANNYKFTVWKQLRIPIQENLKIIDTDV